MVQYITRADILLIARITEPAKYSSVLYVEPSSKLHVSYNSFYPI